MIAKAPPNHAPLTLRWLASISLVVVTVLALANLPTEVLPIPWLLAFTVPGAIIGYWSRIERPRWQRMLLAVILQASACYGALEWMGQMTRPAALACTILPPLAFTTTRNHDRDPSLPLFLSLCVLLVGVILNDLNIGILVGYVVFANLSLHVTTMIECHLACNYSRDKARTRTVISDVMAITMLLLACTAASFVIDRTLKYLPSPAKQTTETGPITTQANHEIGLDNSFILDGGSGPLSSLSSKRILRATHPYGGPVAKDMYLRSGFFTKPSLHQWTTGILNRKKAANAKAAILRLPSPNIRVEQLTIERFDETINYVFLPPYSMQLSGLKNVVVDISRQWVRTSSFKPTTYQVTYQHLPDIGPSARVNSAQWQQTLLRLPGKLKVDRLNQLLDEWGVTNEPHQAMDAIASGLARHCEYSLSQPTGPFPRQIDNFLFANNNRRGYCMHFAAAAALMLRSKNIPCRIGVGLYGGTAEKGTDGARIFGSEHAHAWVEVPFENRGFVIFDPTPPAQRGHSNSNDTQRKASDAPDDTTAASLTELLAELMKTPRAWAILMAGTVLIWLIRWQNLQNKRPHHFSKEPKARRALKKILQALAKAGHPRATGQTLEMFAVELATQDRLPTDVRVALGAYQETRFGGHDFDDARARQLELGHKAAQAMQAETKVTEETGE